MRKIICSLLAIIMIASMCACAKSEDASSKFTSAKTKTDEISSFEAEMKVDFSVGEKGEEKTANSSTVHIRLDRSTSSAPVYYSEYNFKTGEETTSSSIYYEDGKRYEKATTGEKYYYELDPQFVTASFQNVSIDIPEGAFSKSNVSDNSQGGQHIEAQTDTETVKQVLSDFASSVTAGYTANSSGSFDFQFSNLKMSFDTNAEGYFTNISISFTTTFEHSAGTAEADIAVDLSYFNPGQQVTVEKPSDLSEYTPAPDSEDEEIPESMELTEEEQVRMTDEVCALYDENHDRVADYDTKYKELCKTYGKSGVDSVVEMIEALKNLEN